MIPVEAAWCRFQWWFRHHKNGPSETSNNLAEILRDYRTTSYRVPGIDQLVAAGIVQTSADFQPGSAHAQVHPAQ